MSITRIVRMHFTDEGLKAFLHIFDQNKQSIRNFEGCTHLELLVDVKDPLTYTTISHWKDEESLEQYRQSALFVTVWKQVKPLFSRQPEAFSLMTQITL